MRPGERMVIDVKRHPIGILGTYIGVSILIVVLAVLGYVVAPDILTSYTSSQVYGITTAILLCSVILSGLFVLVAHIVYWGNHWIVTNDSITQVLQNSLFSKQSSQLSMANLEDITVEQNGILPHLFDYGLLWAETAGEREKFRFPYCPHPNEVAKQILQERETFMQGPGAYAEGQHPTQQYSPPTGVNQNVG
jgi:hypothetical protein